MSEQKTKDGDAAHPSTIRVRTGELINQQGLTKREYFASMAFQGLVTDVNMSIGDAASYAVNSADALIKALNKNVDK